MHRVVLLRHGESRWNLENKFTGWVDVDLTDKGIAESIEAAGPQNRNNGNCPNSRLKACLSSGGSE